LLARSGKRKEAEKELRQAGDIDGLLELASLYEQAREIEPAIAIYESFLAGGGVNPAVGERLGVLLLDAGRPHDAIPHLEAAAKASPTAANRYALATAFLRDQQIDKAISAMEQAIAADPGNADLRLSYGSLLRDQKKDFKGAAQHFWKATQLKPESKEAWTGLATMLLSLENYPQALAAFDKLESLGDPNPGIYFLRALAFDKHQQYEPALLNYRKFLSLSQDRNPDEEFKARQRVKVIEKELSRR
jgi:tetratricopeptide (TPR) repeat protein